MHRLARVLLQVRAGDADVLGAAVFRLDPHLAGLNDGQFILADLIALGQVRVEVIFSCEHRASRDVCLHRQAEFHRHQQRRLVRDRQDARQAQVNGAGLGVGRRAEAVGGAGKELACRRQLHMQLQADDGLPLPAHRQPSGARWCQSVACWYWCATFNTWASRK